MQDRFAIYIKACRRGKNLVSVLKCHSTSLRLTLIVLLKVELYQLYFLLEL